MKKRVFALIGGIASGKTAVSNILCSLGANIIDADVISHSVTSPGTEGEKKLMERFPLCVRDGKIDRRLLKEKVFGDERELKALNAITHPLIISEIHRQIETQKGVIVVVMPLPVELRRYHAVLNVFTPIARRIERLGKRDNISVELAEKIIASQLSDEEFENEADFTFVNDGNESQLEKAVIDWWNYYVGKQY